LGIFPNPLEVDFQRLVRLFPDHSAHVSCEMILERFLSHFSLSIKLGQIPGRIFDAQSSSVYTSDVAARASRAAFRA
jgi:hypothetical protein